MVFFFAGVSFFVDKKKILKTVWFSKEQMQALCTKTSVDKS
jgi:hypothetical protein